MPYLMSLEGPRVSRLQALHSELYGAAPKPVARAAATLQGLLDPITVPVAAHPWIALLALLGGAWYANKRKRARRR